jgi:parallel beta-helix repeat protein
MQTPTNVEIKNCKVRRHRTGIFVGGGNNVYIHNNDLSDNFTDVDNRRYGEFLGQSEGGGLRLDTVTGGRVEQNIMNNSAIGIDLRDSTRITVRGNTASNNTAWGINLIHTTYSELLNNTVRDNIRWCTWGGGTVGRGCDAGGIIIQDGSSHNVVKGNIVEGDNGNGIFIKAHFMRCDDDNLIQGNKITNAVYNGIELGFCKGNKAIGNEISGSIDGILFGFDTGTEIRNNVISNMTNHGITSWNSRGTIVDGNRITNSREAILFFWDKWDARQFSFLPPSADQYASRDHVISNNVLRDNAVAGIHLLNSSNNRITNNSFANNGRNFWIEGKSQGNVIPALTPGAVVPTRVPSTVTPGPVLSTRVPSTPTPSPAAGLATDIPLKGRGLPPE